MDVAVAAGQVEYCEKEDVAEATVLEAMVVARVVVAALVTVDVVVVDLSFQEYNEMAQLPPQTAVWSPLHFVVQPVDVVWKANVSDTKHCWPSCNPKYRLPAALAMSPHLAIVIELVLVHVWFMAREDESAMHP